MELRIENNEKTSKEVLSSGVNEHFILPQLARINQPEKFFQVLAKLYIKKFCEKIKHPLFDEIVNKLQSKLVSS